LAAAVVAGGKVTIPWFAGDDVVCVVVVVLVVVVVVWSGLAASAGPSVGRRRQHAVASARGFSIQCR
jgi:hypothetical protein